jgi:hypothetical protein
MNAPQIAAIILLIAEIIAAFHLGRDGETIKRGKDLLFDAVLWTAVLIWGGFWT